MSGKRRNHSSSFKFKVVLETLQGDRTVNQIASAHELSPSQVSQWRKNFLANGSGVFDDKRTKKDEDFSKEKARLERKVGELTMSVDFLKKKVAPWYEGASSND
jgi:transposase